MKLEKKQQKTHPRWSTLLLRYCYALKYFKESSFFSLDLKWSNSSSLMSILSLYHKVGAAYKTGHSKNWLNKSYL